MSNSPLMRSNLGNQPTFFSALETRTVNVAAEDGFQALRSAEDWWVIALGSGLRWAIDQMGPQVAARMRADNVSWLSENKIDRLETNAIYAIGHKPS